MRLGCFFLGESREKSCQARPRLSPVIANQIECRHQEQTDEEGEEHAERQRDDGRLEERGSLRRFGNDRHESNEGRERG